MLLFAPFVRGQDDPLKNLSKEYAALESESITENFNRKCAFIILQEYLPPGTRMTSGYRSPEKQLNLIRRMAQSNGIPVPAQMSVNDQSSWQAPLNGLRAKGFIVASPLTTPHATPEMVFDLAGASLDVIKAGVYEAEKAGTVKIRKVIYEAQNGAIHVELESITGKGMTALGRKSAAGASGGGGSSPTSTDAGNSPTQTNNQPPATIGGQTGIISQLQTLHDSETDPAKKIDYDRSIIQLLDPSKDADKINALNAEIETHKNEIAALGQSDEKKKLLSKISAALRDHRFDDAETSAVELADKFSEEKANSKTLLKEIKTRRLFSDASDLYDAGGCSKCAEADQLIDQVLELAPRNQNAVALKQDIAESLQGCNTKRYLLLALVGLLFVAFIAGFGCWMYLANPLQFRIANNESRVANKSAIQDKSAIEPRWILQGVGGFADGETFDLDDFETAEITIGSSASSADIVITDDEKKISRRHCTIFRGNGGGSRFYIMDDSTNGTRVGGEDLPRGEMTELFPNDEISLADKAFLRLTRG